MRKNPQLPPAQQDPRYHDAHIDGAAKDPRHKIERHRREHDRDDELSSRNHDWCHSLRCYAAHVDECLQAARSTQ
eukprot:6582684-Pyramimonas_sp.AAC.1